MPRLSAAIVTYRTDPAVLARCLASLATSTANARAAGLLHGIDLFVVDNGPEAKDDSLRDALSAWPGGYGPASVRRGHGNIGYGRAHNLVLGELHSDFHLVMNADVEMDRDAVTATLRAFRDAPGIGLVTPAVVDGHGSRQFLCKRYPSLWVLFLRGFAPAFLRRRFAASIARYEMRDVIGDHPIDGIPLASGCFMAFRTGLFRALGGFDPRYFMYFEDFDLSLRLGETARIAYVPAARIVHHGGNASAKGWRHVFWFARSAIRFFSSHGWKVA